MKAAAHGLQGWQAGKQVHHSLRTQACKPDEQRTHNRRHTTGKMRGGGKNTKRGRADTGLAAPGRVWAGKPPRPMSLQQSENSQFHQHTHKAGRQEGRQAGVAAAAAAAAAVEAQHLG
eukprot:364899-Chlamydomonas_euryale.AAC.1